MLSYEKIDLKPMSFQILSYLADKEPMRAQDIAEALGLGTRQVDAAVTKSLVRYGFVIRLHKLTRVMKKEYNLISITDRGRDFIQRKIAGE